MDVNELQSTQWLERVGKPFAPRIRMHKATHEQRAADALEYIAAMMWQINEKLTKLMESSDKKSD